MHLRNGKLVLGPDGNPSTLTSTTVSAPSTPSFPLFVGARLSLLHSETSPRRAESQPLSPIGGDLPVPLETVDMDLPTGKPEEAGVDAALGRPRRWDPVGEPPFARYDEHTGSMNDFLMVFELWCKRRGLPQREWCMLLPHYLSGAALRYWIHLFRSDEGQMDWESLKKLLLRVFDSRGRYKQGLALKELRWKGDSQTFIDEFLAVVALGEYCTPAELLAAFSRFYRQRCVVISLKMVRGGLTIGARPRTPLLSRRRSGPVNVPLGQASSKACCLRGMVRKPLHFRPPHPLGKSRLSHASRRRKLRVAILAGVQVT